MMPSVPPAASAPVASAPEYLARSSSGSATWPMVAAVASDEPQIAPKRGARADRGHGDAARPVAHEGA